MLSAPSLTSLHAGRYLVYFSASAANGRHSIGVKSIFEYVLTVISRPYMMTKTKGGNIHKRQPLGSLWGLGKSSGLPQWGQFGNHHRSKVIIIITSTFLLAIPQCYLWNGPIQSKVGPIDQHFFLDPATGKQWLLWKTDHMINPRSSKLLSLSWCC